MSEAVASRCQLFLIAVLFPWCSFNFCTPTPFCSLSGLRQVTSTRCHCHNDSARKTEGVKQSIHCSEVFLLCTASLLGFAERITSLVNAWRKPLLIRGHEGHHFSLSFCFDSVVVKLRSWCLLCALFLGLYAGMLPFLKWALPKQLMVICMYKCYFKEKRDNFNVCTCVWFILVVMCYLLLLWLRTAHSVNVLNTLKTWKLWWHPTQCQNVHLK